MSKAIWVILAIFISFGGGYLFASWNFIYSDTYVLKEPIAIVADGTEAGVLPMGTELHYQSSAHNEVDFYVFVRVPLEKEKLKAEKIEVDTYNGIKRLKGDFE
ncbi:hypothetical protein [Amphritea pacifica]|uniref:Uncharacterized protein n=1 Tax=Amphritea pacifica TaxID=2811233 RepID=A0ABS2WDY1_9GAMM|nr:hypothetical protein [Amphritea pacifica]MBN0989904.1 hypothetical protein [Amphritea pacifica]